MPNSSSYTALPNPYYSMQSYPTLPLMQSYPTLPLMQSYPTLPLTAPYPTLPLMLPYPTLPLMYSLPNSPLCSLTQLFLLCCHTNPYSYGALLHTPLLLLRCLFQLFWVHKNWRLLLIFIWDFVDAFPFLPPRHNGINASQRSGLNEERRNVFKNQVIRRQQAHFLLHQTASDTLEGGGSERGGGLLNVLGVYWRRWGSIEGVGGLLKALGVYWMRLVPGSARWWNCA